MGDGIHHNAKLLKIDKNSLTVALLSEPGCSACALTQVCSKPIEGETLVIHTPCAADFSVGDRVVLVASEKSHSAAVWLAVGVPAIIFLAVLLGAGALGAEEWLAGVIALGACALWFGALYLWRGHISSLVKWSVKPVHDII